jgi:hypothetical protein
LFSLSRNLKYPVKNANKAWYDDDQNLLGFGKDDLRVSKSCFADTSCFGENFQLHGGVKDDWYGERELTTEDTLETKLTELEVFQVVYV